ncbi:MAG: GH92 family glycosyl hydrolase [Bacteroidales bacterium]
MNNFLSFILTIILLQPISVFSKNLAELVDTQIGTKGNGLGCGFNHIGATYPFGMIQFTPSFFSPHKGFVVNQLTGGCPNMGNFPVLPVSGELSKSPQEMNDFPAYDQIINSSAGYLAVKMPDMTRADLTVNKRSGIARFSFPDRKGTVLIGSGINSTFITNAHIEITSATSCEGFAIGGEFCGTPTNYKIYFAVEFDRPATQTGVWTGNALLPNVENAFGPSSGGFFTFDTDQNSQVNYRIAISYVSVENARKNLAASDRRQNFESYLTDCQTEWNRSLAKISVKSDDSDRLVQFYTHLYHSLIYPNIVSDVNGDYMGANFKPYNSDRDTYSSFSVWDTYHTQGQLIAMLYPRESSDMMQSLINFAEQSGGYGRWILANIETGIMQGDPTPILIANSYAFGGQDFDHQTAFKHMKRGATIPLLRSQNQEIRPHLTEYINHGLAPASLMLEYTSTDYAIGLFARHALKNEPEAEFFINRSKLWKNLYNPANKWLHSREANGNWKNIRHDWREATHKNYFWMVPYDICTLIDTIGGKEFAEERLDSLFQRLDAGYEDDWFAAGNEPNLQVPWIYNWTDNPYKTSLTTHRILNEMYNSTPSGIPGNDDLGTLGAWYVFASIGLYPMIPGEGGFSLSVPQFDDVKISFPNGVLQITSKGMKEPYIKNVKFNNHSLPSSWLTWDQISQGGVIKFVTGKSNKQIWKVSPLPSDLN